MLHCLSCMHMRHVYLITHCRIRYLVGRSRCWNTSDLRLARPVALERWSVFVGLPIPCVAHDGVYFSQVRGLCLSKCSSKSGSQHVAFYHDRLSAAHQSRARCYLGPRLDGPYPNPQSNAPLAWLYHLLICWQCDLLETAGFKALRPNTAGYNAREAEYYSLSARMCPSCIVQPKIAEDVSRLIKFLATNTTSNWAVRCGGHTAWGPAADSKTAYTTSPIYIVPMS